MQFQIPQFIEVEDKIAGPLTLKQVLYLILAGGISLLFYFIFNFWFWILMTALLITTSLVFGFAKYNGQPIVKIFFAGINFLLKPKFYLWKREEETITVRVPTEKILARRQTLGGVFNQMPSVKKLWDDLITTKNPIPKREKNMPGLKPSDRIVFIRKLSGAKATAKRVDYR